MKIDSDFVESVVSSATQSSEIMQELRDDPARGVRAVAKTAERAMEKDPWNYRIVISTLSMISLAVVGAAIAAAFTFAGQENVRFPDILIALVSASIGALAGILAPQSRGG